VFAGSVVVSAGQDTVDTHTTTPAPAAAPPPTGSSTINNVSPGTEVHPYAPTHGRDRSLPKRRATARGIGISPLEVTAPTAWFVTSYAPASMRNDFDGEVGVALTLAADQIVSWIGIMVTTDNTGTRTVNLYDAADQATPLRTVGIDVADGILGAYAWVAIEPILLSAGSTYMLASTVTDAGYDWGDIAPATYLPIISASAAVYRASGNFTTSTVGQQYVGLDLGWIATVPPIPVDPEDMLDPMVDLYTEGGGTDHLLDPPVEGWPAIIEDPVYGFMPEGWVLVKVVWATEDDDDNRKQVMVWQPDYETVGYVYNWNMVKGFYVTEFIEEYEEIVEGETVTIEGVIAAIEPEDDEWISGPAIEANPIEEPSP